MVIDKRTMFLLRICKNIAAMSTEEERSDALLSVKADYRNTVEKTVKAMLERPAANG